MRESEPSTPSPTTPHTPHGQALGPRSLAAMLWVSLPVLVGLTACGTHHPPPSSLTPPTHGAAAPQPTAPQRNYLLQVADTFDVKFFRTPELNESVVVRPDGKISLQLVGEVQAAGLSVPELEQSLRTLYAQELRRPTVSVIVRTFSPSRVFVAGEVRSPGEQTMNGDLTALQAIARAGFFTPDAQTGQVVILRYKGPQGPEFITLDAGAMIDASRATSAENPLHAQQDVVLEPMDVVYVAPTRIATVADFFSRYVNNIIPLWRNLGFSMVYYTNTVKTRTSGSVTSTPPTNP